MLMIEGCLLLVSFFFFLINSWVFAISSSSGKSNIGYWDLSLSLYAPPRPSDLVNVQLVYGQKLSIVLGNRKFI